MKTDLSRNTGFTKILQTMGWQTDLFCNITFNRETFNSLSSVEDKIAELNDYIRYNTGVLRAYALMTEPDKLLSLAEDEDPLDRINRTVDETLEELEMAYIERWKLEMLRENWSRCHTKEGLAINPPKGAEWPNAYLDGDFINSVTHPNGNHL